MNERLDNRNNNETSVSPEFLPLDKSASKLAEQISRDKFLDDFRSGYKVGFLTGASSAMADVSAWSKDKVIFSPKDAGGDPGFSKPSERKPSPKDDGGYPSFSKPLELKPNSSYTPSYGSAPVWHGAHADNTPAYEGSYPHSVGGSGNLAAGSSYERSAAPAPQSRNEYQSVVPQSSAGAQGHTSSGRQSDAGSQSVMPMPPQSGMANEWSDYNPNAGHSSGPVEAAPTAEPGLEMRSLIARNPERMDLATDIVNDIISGGTASTYREQISALSAGERLDLATDLHATVADYNQQLGLTPGLDKEALLVDVRVGRDDEYVNDIDILRGSSSKAEPERVMESIDLYDPDFWTGVRREGREVDQKQALDAVTAPYEMLARASLQATEAVNKRNPGDTVALREARARSLEGHDDYAVEKMLNDRYYSVSDRDSRADELAENLKTNFANADSVLLTENTRPLFVESSMTARNELRPSREVKELTDSFRTTSKW